MPFTYRHKPNLVDRLRGKTGEEILNELQNDLDTEGRRMFFDSPSWRTRHNNSEFPRDHVYEMTQFFLGLGEEYVTGINNQYMSLSHHGFPFTNDQNRVNIRTYLDDIASRYPEFADQLKERPWTKDFVEPSFKETRSDNKTNQSNEASGSGQKLVEEKIIPQNLSNFGLRNTVPLGPGVNLERNRHQRSMSAPPENRGGKTNKRFVTKCEIPVMNNPTQDSLNVRADHSGRSTPEPAQQKANNAPNVRVIPIVVEGRDAPLVNAHVDTATNFGAESFMEPSFEGRLPRDFGSYQRHSPRFAHKERAPTPPQYQYAPHYQQYVPPSQHFMPPQQPQFMPQQQFSSHEQQTFVPQQQQQQPPQQQPPQKPPAPPPAQQQSYQQQPGCKLPQSDETDAKAPQVKTEPVKDPVEKVQAIQKDVEELMRQVEAFKGNSRTDKQYLMLDELLTRQLLLLDNIDTEGKENVRQARKDTIRSIQRCISTLENKVPLLENKECISGSKNEGGDKITEIENPQPMNVDSTKENPPLENKESQKMDVDEQGNKESQEDRQQQEPHPHQTHLQKETQEQTKEEK